MSETLNSSVTGFQTLTAACVPLNRNNIDTDQIIPARFLKGTVKSGLGEKLFCDWRYLPDGGLNPEFPLNQLQFAGARILISADNFGCGSSREHAPWALKDYGFQAIIAMSFADIFKNNALKNQLLPIALPEPVVNALLQAVEAFPALEVTIDLFSQTVQISSVVKSPPTPLVNPIRTPERSTAGDFPRQGGTFIVGSELCSSLTAPIFSGGSYPFEIDPYRKECLLQGLDDIGYTMSHLAEIERYEKTHQLIIGDRCP